MLDLTDLAYLLPALLLLPVARPKNPGASVLPRPPVGCMVVRECGDLRAFDEFEDLDAARDVRELTAGPALCRTAGDPR